MDAEFWLIKYSLRWSFTVLAASTGFQLHSVLAKTVMAWVKPWSGMDLENANSSRASIKLFSSTDTGSILTRQETHAVIPRSSDWLTLFRFTQDIELIDLQLPLSLQMVLTSMSAPSFQRHNSKRYRPLDMHLPSGINCCGLGLDSFELSCPVGSVLYGP